MAALNIRKSSDYDKDNAFEKAHDKLKNWSDSDLDVLHFCTGYATAQLVEEMKNNIEETIGCCTNPISFLDGLVTYLIDTDNERKSSRTSNCNLQLDTDTTYNQIRDCIAKIEDVSTSCTCFLTNACAMCAKVSVKAYQPQLMKKQKT